MLKNYLIESDSDCFGLQDEDKNKFDYRHFFFTIMRGSFFLFFSLFYLFSSRFSAKGKLLMLLLGFVNASVVAIPILAYVWPPASDLVGEPSLVWAPLIFYLLMLLTHSTIEGRWRDTGGTAASLNYLDSYTAIVQTKQKSNDLGVYQRHMRGGELVMCLIESEQSQQSDPWEYIVLCFVISPLLGLVKAGLFIIVDYWLISKVVPINDNPFVHVLYGWSMLINAITTTLFLSLLSVAAYIYRRQLLLLRLVGSVTNKKEAVK